MNRVLIDEGLSSPGGATGIGNYSDTLYLSLLEKTKNQNGWQIQYRNYSNWYFIPRKVRRLAYLAWINSVGQMRQKDIVHYTNYYVPFLKMSRAKQVVNIHDTAVWDIPEMYSAEFVRFMRAVNTAAARKSDMVITCTETMRQSIIGRLGMPAEKVEVCSYAVKSHYRFLDLPRGDFILYLGNIDKHKNVPTLVRAFDALRCHAAYSHYQLIIVGKKREGFDEALEIIEAKGLQDAVKIPGYLSDDEILDYYNRARCVVMPSFYEGFGIPIIEAMACGAPVIASDIPVFREAVSDAGLIYGNPSDVDALTAALIKLIDSAALQEKLRQKGLKRAVLFTPEESARRHLEIYSKILA